MGSPWDPCAIRWLEIQLPPFMPEWGQQIEHLIEENSTMTSQEKPLQNSLRPQISQPFNGHLDLRSLSVSSDIKYLIQHGDSIGLYPSHFEALAAVLSALTAAGYDDGHVARLCLLEEHGISGLPRQKGAVWFNDQLKQARRRANSMARQTEGEPEDTDDLLMDTITPHRPIVENLLYEGMMLFGGKSKRGKSWLMLDLAVSVATGTPVWGHFTVPDRQPVLYISLEDGRGRIKQRLEYIRPGLRTNGYLHCLYKFPMLDQGGMEKLQGFIQSGRYRLIIIDVLARIEPAGKRGSEKTYLEIYDMFAPLQDLHHEHPTCLAMVTHLRKADAEDIFDTLHGSVGYQGVQDALWAMERPPRNNVAVIHTRPNEGEEQALHVCFVDGHWKFLGHDEEIKLSQERQDVIELLNEYEGGLSIAEVTKLRSQPRERYRANKQLMHRMLQDGQIVRIGRGRYAGVRHANGNGKR